MKLIDILKELEIRSGADVSEDQWIIFINSALRTYGRYIGRLQYQDIAGMFVIDGVIDFSGGQSRRLAEEAIKSVWANGVQLEPVRFDEPEREGTYLILAEDKIKVNVDTWEDGGIWHYTVVPANTRDKSNSDDEYNGQDLGVDDEYINAVIYGALAEYGEVAEDIEMANNYRSKALDVVSRAMQGRYQKLGKYPTTRDVM